jgi:transposase-like protein
MVVRIAGNRMYLWRAVDHEGEVLDLPVQPRRDTRAALGLTRKLFREQCFAPRLVVVTRWFLRRHHHKLTGCHGQGRGMNNRAEKQVVRRRERKTQHFKSAVSAPLGLQPGAYQRDNPLIDAGTLAVVHRNRSSLLRNVPAGLSCFT